MAYDDQDYDDEVESSGEECEFCGRVRGHDPDCMLGESYDYGEGDDDEE